MQLAGDVGDANGPAAILESGRGQVGQAAAYLEAAVPVARLPREMGCGHVRGQRRHVERRRLDPEILVDVRACAANDSGKIVVAVRVHTIRNGRAPPVTQRVERDRGQQPAGVSVAEPGQPQRHFQRIRRVSRHPHARLGGAG